jgi:polyhydroxyalkanoate synthesis regulator phasin
MLFLEDQATEQGKAFAEVGRRFLSDVYKSKKKFLEELPKKMEAAAGQLSQIWWSYETARSYDPIRLEVRIAKSRDAQGKLFEALEMLSEVPRQTLADYNHRYRDEQRVGFPQILEELESIRLFAERFDRKLKTGVAADEPTTRAAHSLARLFADISGKKFSKNLRYANSSKTEFAYPGAEFVRLILEAIDPSIPTSAVATALKSSSQVESGTN